ncbi:MAG: hypothetical protein QXP36_10825, partial [Conexivisphaerales archaeon]
IRRFLAANKGRGIKQVNPVRLAIIRNWKTFVNSPLLAFGFIVYQTVKYFSASLGFIFSLKE